MKRCLIVDDSRIIRRVARRIMEDLGFKAEEAVDGDKAIDAVRVSMPEIILLDWEMPNLSGPDFVTALRRLPGGAGPKVVFCAIENDVEHIQRALDAGADEYIMKPFDGEIVRAKLDIIGMLD
ncbi:MAG: response regulator [Alphaproteobacteria bacterium]|nr:response regulator [Alphaproteobacteria bacterium]